MTRGTSRLLEDRSARQGRLARRRFGESRMQYLSTRGSARRRDFVGVLLTGLAEDGGLYVPEAWPRFSSAEMRALRGLSYAELAAAVMAPFVGEALPGLVETCRETYARFDHPAVAPLVQLESGLFVLELFHGPTLAFKDFALQLVARWLAEVPHERLTVIGATSGDTGAAAIEALRDQAGIAVVILHPEGRISETQRRQMTTVDAENVLNIAVKGSFDDCQALVKAMFADQAFRASMRLSAVNSINWARIAAQIPYYFAAALALGAPDREVAFSVPSGNFGNVFAAWAASRMGLPIARLVVATNRNDILARFLGQNDMSVHQVEPSLSPAMDIQVSSNFERLLFEALDRDGAAVANRMRAFAANGRLVVPDAAWRELGRLFCGFSLDDAATEGEMARTWRTSHYLADPHTAVGIGAARAMPAGAGIPMIAVATAHPAKFAATVQRATGASPALPARLERLYQLPERSVTAANDLGTVEALVRSFVERTGSSGERDHDR